MAYAETKEKALDAQDPDAVPVVQTLEDAVDKATDSIGTVNVDDNK